MGPGDLVQVIRLVRGGSGERDVSSPHRFWDPSATDAFGMSFPASVDVHLRDGSVRSASADVPRGGAGNDQAGPEQVARERFAALTPRLWDDTKVDEIDRAIEEDADDLVTLLGPR
jgi:hypothetical protein